MQTHPTYFPLHRRWPWDDFTEAEERQPTLLFNCPLFSSLPNENPLEEWMVLIMITFTNDYINILDRTIQLVICILQPSTIMHPFSGSKVQAPNYYEYDIWHLISMQILGSVKWPICKIKLKFVHLPTSTIVETMMGTIVTPSLEDFGCTLNPSPPNWS